MSRCAECEQRQNTRGLASRAFEGKQVKNRLHIGLSPPAEGDQGAEVDRLVSFGATPVDVGLGPGQLTWAVLATTDEMSSAF